LSFHIILQGFDNVLMEVLTAISPVLVLFLLFLVVFKLPRSMLLTLLKGIVFAFAGLTLFLQGVKVGFMPVGMEMGAILGDLPYRWILIPIGFILGFVATLAEPAVRILSDQVEKSSSGYIKSTIILFTLCFSVGLFIALGMTRVVYGIPFYYIIIPGYLFAIILMFFSKPSFTAIAFDSGGVATGPMTVTFIMALAVGAADQIAGRDAIIDGFGLIAMVALAPIIMVMLLGFLYPDPEENEEEIEDNAFNNGDSTSPAMVEDERVKPKDQAEADDNTLASNQHISGMSEEGFSEPEVHSRDENDNIGSKEADNDD
jgi:hypothetical protein